MSPVTCRTAAPIENGCEDNWTWNSSDKSPEVSLLGTHNEIVHFHPNWSNGTAGVRGTKPLCDITSSSHYWEIRVSKRLFGTSMMFGVASSRARLHVDSFINLLGESEESWALSHKGLLWHDGKCREYTAPFKENETTTLGLLLDGRQGTLAFYKDGVSLGVAFTGLNQRPGLKLYPALCSTAAKTEMILVRTLRTFENLQDRCRAVVVQRLNGSVDQLPLPGEMKKYVIQSVPTGSRSPDTSKKSDERRNVCDRVPELILFRKRVKQQLTF